MSVLQVTNVTPRDRHVLRLEFNDGAVGDLACSFLLAQGLGMDLRDPAYFALASLDDDLHTVVWPNGLDPAPELLRSQLVPVGVNQAVA